MKWIFPLVAILLASCCRNLDQDVTLNIDDSAMTFSIYAENGYGDYFHPGDSSGIRHALFYELKRQFNEKGNDVTVVASNGDYTLTIQSCCFSETMTGTTVQDPCDSIPPYDQLHYDIHQLKVSMQCTLTDQHGHSKTIYETASDEESVKDHPTVLQSLFGHSDCYTPDVRSILNPDKLQQRVLRRAHRQAMCAIKSWL